MSILGKQNKRVYVSKVSSGCCIKFPLAVAGFCSACRGKVASHDNNVIASFTITCALGNADSEKALLSFPKVSQHLINMMLTDMPTQIQR